MRYFAEFILGLAVVINVQAAHYDTATDRLHIDALQVGAARYQVELQHQGNLLFSLEKAQPSAMSDAEGIYSNGRAQLEALWLGEQSLRAELFALDNGLFMGTLLNQTPSPSKTANYNPEAVIPAMCYTDTEGRYNPCYTCHQAAINGIGHENRMDDGDLQGDYSFSELGRVNRWENLFIDRSEAVAALSDAEILDYINQDNYSALAERLREQDFQGWIPDLEQLADPAQAFAADGFARDGSHWVAFNYKPLPSTFWPTNGSTDDVMIRLPEAFRNDSDGHYSKAVYQANLAIVEAAVKDLERISVPPLDENALGADLNGDGVLGEITEISRPAHYIGAAADIAVTTFLYPQGTEFLHTVRYVGVDEQGAIFPSPRMKEVRYMIKTRFYSKPILGGFYAGEQFEKYQGMYPYYNSLGDKGLDNGFGWRLQAFIENATGELRPQTYEEHFFCMGCHTTIGGTIDKVFSFTRKIDGAAGWGYIDLRGMPDAPAKGESEGEFLRYLRLVGGGDEFRQNEEMIQRWFHADGTLDEAKVKAAEDIYHLITPSRERALTLNKAYRVIVEEQSYIRGRDASVTPARRVLRTVNTEIPPLPEDKRVQRDMRLDWVERAGQSH